MPGCDFPGCRKNSHAYDYYKDESKKYSFHRVPDAHRQKIADLLGLTAEKRQKTNMFICDSHIKPGSFIHSNKKRKIRNDVPFPELIILPDMAAAAAAAAAAAVNTSNSHAAMDTSSFANSYSDDSYISHSLVEPDDEEEPEEPPLPVKVKLPFHNKRKSNPPSLRRITIQPTIPSVQPQLNKSCSELSSRVDEVKMLMTRIAGAELRALHSERKSQELDDTLNKTRAQFMSEAECKDKEIAGLKKQLQQAIAENKALAEANKSMAVDLNVYRKLIQLESKSAAVIRPRSPSGSPVRKQWRGMRESSIDVDLGDEETESESLATNGSGQFKNETRGSLEEIKKWLKSSKKC